MSSVAATTPASPVGEIHVGQRVSRGLGWSLLGQGLTRVGVFATGIVLARLLTPDDFGEVAAGLLVANLLMAVNELGVIPALVRWQGDVTHASSTGATLAFVNSVLLYGVAFVSAPAVAAVANVPGAVPIIRILALTVLVDGVVAVPIALLARDLRTVPQLVAEVVGMVVYAAVAVGLAAGDWGGSAVAWARTLGAVVTGVLLVWAAPWPSRPGLDRAVAASLLRFGLPVAMSTLVLEAVLNVDYLLVGRELGGAAVGTYLLAFNLSSWPVSIVSVAVARVSFAGFAALVGDDDRLQRGFVRAIGVALSATVPLVLLLIVVAPELVSIVYGDRWAAAVSPLRWLLVIGGLRVVFELAGEVVAAVGRPAAILRVRVVWLLLLVPAIDVGVEHAGLRGAGIAHVAVAVGVVLPLLLRELRASGIAPARLGGVALRPVVAGAGAVLAALVSSTVVDGLLARLTVLAMTGAIAYGVLLLPRNPLVGWVLAQLRGNPAGAA